MSEEVNLSVQKKKSVDFDIRLHNARNANNGSATAGNMRQPDDGKSKAIRISTELIVAVSLGALIGWVLDDWLDTKPWLLVIFLLLGNAAGLWNIFRLTNGHKYKIGFEDNKKPRA